MVFSSSPRPHLSWTVHLCPYAALPHYTTLHCFVVHHLPRLQFLANATDLDIIRHRPDLPPMRNFEINPHMGSRGANLEQDFKRRQILMGPVLRADGIITNGTPEIEPESTRTTPEMMGIPLYAVGYSSTESAGSEIDTVPKSVNSLTVPTDTLKVKHFLDDCLTKYGKRSLAYVR